MVGFASPPPRRRRTIGVIPAVSRMLSAIRARLFQSTIEKPPVIRMCSQSYNMYRQGAMQASPLHSTPPPPLRGLSNGSQIGIIHRATPEPTPTFSVMSDQSYPMFGAQIRPFQVQLPY